MGFVQLEQGKG